MTTTIPARLADHAREAPDDPALFRRAGEGWQATSWRQLAGEVRRAAKALLHLGFERGDHLAILGGNRPEWAVSALAAMTAGGAPAGIYTTSSPDQIGYILGHAECPLVVVENREQWEKVAPLVPGLPRLKRIVLMQAGDAADTPGSLSWDEFLRLGEGVPDADLDQRLASLSGEEVATLIYTSGTTGPPKAAMLSHANLVATARLGFSVFGAERGDRAFSYLPLAHVAEQMFSIHIPVYFGYAVYYCAALDRLAVDLPTVQPTIFFGVPRVFERIHAALLEKTRDLSGVKRRLLDWTLATGRKVAAAKNRGRRPGPWLALQQRITDRLLAAKVRTKLGLGKVRVCACGAAPIAAEVLELFAGLGVILYEVYGQTEVCGPTTWNRPGHTRLGSVGPALPEVEVRLAEDGEVLVRGPNVFLGYFKDPAATAEALRDGWLCSGDLGRLDEDGFLYITGRKKELLITSNGKNVAPNNLESRLKNAALIAEAVVVGDRRHYLTALVTLDPEVAGRLAAEHRLDGDRGHDQPLFQEKVQEVVDEVNRGFSRAENIRKFRILPGSLTIAAGELTPTLKVRRQVVYEKYSGLIDEMYAE